MRIFYCIIIAYTVFIKANQNETQKVLKCSSTGSPEQGGAAPSPVPWHSLPRAQVWGWLRYPCPVMLGPGAACGVPAPQVGIKRYLSGPEKSPAQLWASAAPGQTSCCVSSSGSGAGAAGLGLGTSRRGWGLRLLWGSAPAASAAFWDRELEAEQLFPAPKRCTGDLWVGVRAKGTRGTSMGWR